MTVQSTRTPRVVQPVYAPPLDPPKSLLAKGVQPVRLKHTVPPYVQVGALKGPTLYGVQEFREEEEKRGIMELIWHEDFGYMSDTERRNLKGMIPENHKARYSSLSLEGPIGDVIARLHLAREDGAQAITSSLGGWDKTNRPRLIGSRPLRPDEEKAAKARSVRAKEAARVRKLKAEEKKRAQYEKLGKELGL